LPREAKLEAKRAELARLRADWPAAVPEDANNAWLVSIGLYNDLVPAFEVMLAESGSLGAFYERVKDLARSEERRRSFGTRVAGKAG
jgi:predicted aminopeptidase